MPDLFTSALSGMNAAQYGLATTEHNIVNASTPGYTRQEVTFSASPAQRYGAGFIGRGVDVTGVRRIYDQFLNTQVLQEQNQASYLTAYHAAIMQVDNLVADPAAGVSPAIQSFFNALNGVASNPESVPARQTMISSAQFAINRFRAIDQRLTDIAEGLTKQITSSTSLINSYAQQIAALNGNIKRASAGSLQGQLPNDLIDQRDQLISQLNTEIKTTVLQQADGSVSVLVGNGQVLVTDERAMRLQVVRSENDSSKVDVAYRDDNGRTITMQQSSLTGGKIGAYLAFRDQTLEPARNALGRVALGMAININEQNRLGQDLKGVVGGDIFSVASPLVGKYANNNPTSGTPVVTIADVSSLTTSDYRLSFVGGNYVLQRLSDNMMTSYATLPQTVDGMMIDAPALVAEGDSFLIRPTANGARDIALITTDPARIAAAAPMRGTSALSNVGTAKISNGTVNAPPPLDINLQQTVTITFNDPPTTFNVFGTGTGDPVFLPYMDGQDITYNGWTVQIAGTPVAGDVFTVASNTNAYGDNRNALLMAGMQTQNLMSNGTASLQGAYGQLVGEIGVKASEITVLSKAQDNMVAQTIAAQQSISGVNLDEEASNLIRYQKAYQAAAKALQIAQGMFDTILAIGR